MSAGTIAITGTTEPITLEESRDHTGLRYRHTRFAKPTFVDGATIRVETTGGADVPALTATITAPPEVRGFDLPAALSRSGYTVTWTPHEGTAIEILVGAMSSRTRDGAYLLCRAPDTGAFTIPASTFALVPPAFDRAIVLVSRVVASTQLAGDASVSVEARREASSQVIPLLPADGVVIESSDTTPRRIFDIGLGSGGMSRNGDAAPYAAPMFRLQLGQRIGHHLHLIEDVTVLDTGNIAPDTTEDHVSFGAGVRWTPFEPRRNPSRVMILPGSYLGPFRAVYLTALVGADERDRAPAAAPSVTTAASPMASLALCLHEIAGRDWSYGLECREQLVHYY